MILRRESTASVESIYANVFFVMILFGAFDVMLNIVRARAVIPVTGLKLTKKGCSIVG